LTTGKGLRLQPDKGLHLTTGRGLSLHPVVIERYWLEITVKQRRMKCDGWRLLTFSVIISSFLILMVALKTSGNVDGERRHEVIADVDTDLTDHEVFGDFHPNRNYVVLSLDTNPTDTLSEAASLLPTTTTICKSGGYDSIVLITGSADIWHSDARLYETFRQMRHQDAVVVFIKLQSAFRGIEVLRQMGWMPPNAKDHSASLGTFCPICLLVITRGPTNAVLL
jgi:hypothetical protein